MTKLRPPLSFERAIVRIADVLGWATMGALVDRSPRTVQDWSDPDVPSRISLDDAFALEEAYVAAGAEGRPISDCWRLRLGLTEHGAASDRARLSALLARVCKEGGEAQAAVVTLLTAGPAGDRRTVRREVAEHIDALHQLLANLDDGTVPDGGGDGEPPLGGGNP